MRIGVLGATGTIGGCVVEEARGRGHEVAEFGRRVFDPLDERAMTGALDGLDVVVNAISPGREPADAVRDAAVLPAVARTLLAAMTAHPRVRAIVVGGAGSLEVRPGLQVVDVPGFAEGLPERLGVPVDYVEAVRAHRAALRLYRLSDRLWTYLSPSAGRVERGGRTGRFRVGGDQLLDGPGGISAEDLAVAVVDEAEQARHVQRRFTVGY